MAWLPVLQGNPTPTNELTKKIERRIGHLMQRFFGWWRALLAACLTFLTATMVAGGGAA